MERQTEIALEAKLKGDLTRLLTLDGAQRREIDLAYAELLWMSKVSGMWHECMLPIAAALARRQKPKGGTDGPQ